MLDHDPAFDERRERGHQLRGILPHAAARGETPAAAVLDGVLSILGGERPRFSLEYACDPPCGRHWFAVSVVPCADPRGGGGRTEITARKRPRPRRSGGVRSWPTSRACPPWASWWRRSPTSSSSPDRHPSNNAQAGRRLLDVEPADMSEVREVLADIIDDDRRAVDLIRRLRTTPDDAAVERAPPGREERPRARRGQAGHRRRAAPETSRWASTWPPSRSPSAGDPHRAAPGRPEPLLSTPWTRWRNARPGESHRHRADSAPATTEPPGSRFQDHRAPAVRGGLRVTTIFEALLHRPGRAAWAWELLHRAVHPRGPWWRHRRRAQQPHARGHLQRHAPSVNERAGMSRRKHARQSSSPRLTPRSAAALPPRRALTGSGAAGGPVHRNARGTGGTGPAGRSARARDAPRDHHREFTPRGRARALGRGGRSSSKSCRSPAGAARTVRSWPRSAMTPDGPALHRGPQAAELTGARASHAAGRYAPGSGERIGQIPSPVGEEESSDDAALHVGGSGIRGDLAHRGGQRWQRLPALPRPWPRVKQQVERHLPGRPRARRPSRHAALAVAGGPAPAYRSPGRWPGA